jgi:mono/diheme cytochrome c family protein
MKNFIGGIFTAVIVLIILSLMYIWSGMYDVSQLSPHGQVTKWIINKTMMHSIKKRTKKIEVPDLNDSSKITLGFRHYEEMCVICHLAPGVKESEIGMGLYPEPPEFTEKKNLPDARGGFWIVQNGIKMTGMPAFSTTHKDEEIWAIVAFVVKRLPGMTEADYKMMKELYPPDND